MWGFLQRWHFIPSLSLSLSPDRLNRYAMHLVHVQLQRMHCNQKYTRIQLPTLVLIDVTFEHYIIIKQ